MTGLALILVLLFGAQAPQPAARITRAALSGLEKNFDGRFQRANVTDPFDVLGTTRAVYLDGYGAVFSAELNLIVTPNLNPFHQFFTTAEKARIHERKLQRLPLLKQNMREMLIASAVSSRTCRRLSRWSWQSPCSTTPGKIRAAFPRRS